MRTEGRHAADERAKLQLLATAAVVSLLPGVGTVLDATVSTGVDLATGGFSWKGLLLNLLPGPRPKGAAALKAATAEKTAVKLGDDAAAVAPGPTILQPHPKAEGPHTVFKSDDKGVTGYETYDFPEANVGKRVDVIVPAHGGVPTPHVHATRRHFNPKDPSKSRIEEAKKARPALQDETPTRRP